MKSIFMNEQQYDEYIRDLELFCLLVEHESTCNEYFETAIKQAQFHISIMESDLYPLDNSLPYDPKPLGVLPIY